MRIEYKKLFKYTFVIYSIIVAIQFLLSSIVRNGLNKELHKIFLKEWYFSDWLINFEGGFVRRGLWGEIILFLYDCFNIDIAHTIIFITRICTLFIIIYTIYFFRKKRLSLILLPNIILFGGFAINNIQLYRRDALMLLIVFLTLSLYNKWDKCKEHKTEYWFLTCLSGIFAILTHEASFFCFVPFMILHCFCNNFSGGYIMKGFKTILFFMPVSIAMICACVFKGNEEIANSIWGSYTPYFNNVYGETIQMGKGVNALTWSTQYAAGFHLTVNYLSPLLFGYIPPLAAWCVIFIMALYLMVNVNNINLFKYEQKDICNTYLASIILIQFISLLPMFTILSCDFGRIFMYWSLTSFFIFYKFEQKEYPIFSSIGRKVHQLFNNRYFSHSSLYILIWAVIMVPFSGFYKAQFTSVIGNIIHFFTSAVKLITDL